MISKRVFGFENVIVWYNSPSRAPVLPRLPGEGPSGVIPVCRSAEFQDKIAWCENKHRQRNQCNV